MRTIHLSLEHADHLEQQLERHPPDQATVALHLTDDVFLRSFSQQRPTPAPIDDEVPSLLVLQNARQRGRGSRAPGRRIVDEEFHAVPGGADRVACGDLVAVIGRALRGIQRRLQRLLKELLDAGGREGQNHAHRFRALIVEAMHGPARDVHEVPGPATIVSSSRWKVHCPSST